VLAGGGKALQGLRMPKFGNPAQHLAQHPPKFFGTSNPPKFIGNLHPTSPMTFPLTKEDEFRAWRTPLHHGFEEAT